MNSGLVAVAHRKHAAAQGSGADRYVMTSHYREGLTGLTEMGLVGERLWAQSGLTSAVPSNGAGGSRSTTRGGRLGEACIHGMNGVAEGVCQLRGTSVNQVRGIDNVVVTAGAAVSTSALVVTRRRWVSRYCPLLPGPTVRSGTDRSMALPAGCFAEGEVSHRPIVCRPYPDVVWPTPLARPVFALFTACSLW
ncbi:hypothetical protein ABH922_000185 [Rhodococcus sp. 27YEA15]